MRTANRPVALLVLTLVLTAAHTVWADAADTVRNMPAELFKKGSPEGLICDQANQGGGQVQGWYYKCKNWIFGGGGPPTLADLQKKSCGKKQHSGECTQSDETYCNGVCNNHAYDFWYEGGSGILGWCYSGKDCYCGSLK